MHSVMTSLGRQTDCPSQLAASALATVQSPVSFVSCQSLIYALCISAFSLIVLFEIFKGAYTLSICTYVQCMCICYIFASVTQLSVYSQIGLCLLYPSIISLLYLCVPIRIY